MKIKICTKCGNEYPATLKYFYKQSQKKSGLHPNCKGCVNEAQKKYNQTKKGKAVHQKALKIYNQRHPEKIKNSRRKWEHTFEGYLRRKFYGMKRRCNNPKYWNYKIYGGRGIRCLFTSDEFVDYVKNDMGVTDISQIKGLQIDRTNNDGHYEKGNIRFVTAKVNMNNQEKNNAKTRITNK